MLRRLASRLRPPRSLGFVVVLGVLAAPLTPGSTHARVPGSGEPPTISVLDLPADVDVAISIRGAVWASREPSGRAARHMVEELAGDMGLPSAWDELWRTLELEPGQAVDRLLGRHVILAWRSSPGPAAPDADAPARTEGRLGSDADWVLLSLVDERIEHRLRERLRPAPRDVQAGQTILSLEDGRYLLTTRRLDPEDSPRREQTDLAIIMLAPAEHDALFRQMLARLGGAACDWEGLASEPRLAGMGDFARDELVMVVRVPAEHSQGAPGAGAISVTSARWRRGEDLAARGPGLDARIVIEGGVNATLASGGLSLPDLERVATPDAVVALSDARRFGSEQADPTPGRAGFRFRAPSASSSATIAGLLSLLDLDPSTRLSVGPRSLAMLRCTGERGDILSFTMGVAVTDIDAVAPHLDASLARILSEDEHPGPDFGGRYPTAVRVAPLPTGSPLSLRAILGEGATLAWQYPPQAGAIEPFPRFDPGQSPLEPAPRRPANLVTAGTTTGRADSVPSLPSAAAPTEATDHHAAPAPRPADAPARASYWAVPGWWVVQLAPHDASSPEELRVAADILASAPERSDVAASGIVRPARLLSAMASAGIPFPPTLRVLRWIPSLSWETRQVSATRQETTLRLDLDPRMRAQP